MKKVKGSFLFKVTASDGTVHEWLIDLKKGNGSVTKAPGEERLNITSSLVLLVVHSTARVCMSRLWEMHWKPPKYGRLFIPDMQCSLHGVRTRGFPPYLQLFPDHTGP